MAEDGNYKDVELSVAFKAVAGEKDQGGGLVWRYRDANNYYVCRMNPLEDNYRLYKVVAGKRIQLETKEELKVPVGTAGIVQAKLADAPPADLASLKYYIVKRGDTLPLIARKLHVNKADLAEANYLSATARVGAGQKLMVPHEATVLMAARTDRPVPATEARRTVAEAGQLAQDATTNRVKVSYEVKRGDTLASIARQHKTTIASLKTWNPKLSNDRLTAGERLTLYRLAN